MNINFIKHNITQRANIAWRWEALSEQFPAGGEEGGGGGKKAKIVLIVFILFEQTVISDSPTPRTSKQHIEA